MSRHGRFFGLTVLGIVFVFSSSAQAVLKGRDLDLAVPANTSFYRGLAKLYDREWGQFFCGGAFVSEQVIVTAAHCFEDHEEKNILFYAQKDFVLATVKLEPLRIKQVVLHPMYAALYKTADRTVWNLGGADLALVILERPSKYGVPMTLPDTEKYFANQYWGGSSSRRFLAAGKLDGTDFKKYDGYRFAIAVQTEVHPYVGRYVEMEMLGGAAICAGDSGYPMVVTQKPEFGPEVILTHFASHIPNVDQEQPYFIPGSHRSCSTKMRYFSMLGHVSWIVDTVKKYLPGATVKVDTPLKSDGTAP